MHTHETFVCVCVCVYIYTFFIFRSDLLLIKYFCYGNTSFTGAILRATMCVFIIDD